MKGLYKQQARISAFKWYTLLTVDAQGSIEAMQIAHTLRRRGYTYCQIRDLFAGMGIK